MGFSPLLQRELGQSQIQPILAVGLLPHSAEFPLNAVISQLHPAIHNLTLSSMLSVRSAPSRRPMDVFLRQQELDGEATQGWQAAPRL
jgi:hypothetical protein